MTAQKKAWDCGVACLAMLLGRPYGDVVEFVRATLDPVKLRRRGLTIEEMRDVAFLAGGLVLSVRRRRAGFLDGRTGIVGIKGEGMDRAGHWVVLKAGVIVDPDGAEVWTVADYLARHKARPTVLLTEAK